MKIIEKKSNLFLVNTEYQLLLCVSLILKNYQDPATFRNKIIINNSATNARIHIPSGTSEINADIALLKTNYNTFKKEAALTETLKKISQEKFEKFISFFEHNPIHYYLAYKLSKKGTTVGLGQDGMKAYARIKRFTFFAQIKATIRLYRFLISKHLFIPHFALVSYRFGYHPLTKELWLTHPEGYNNWSKKELNIINTLLNENELKLVKKFFGFPPSEIKTFENVIFYINQPVNSLEKTELQLIKTLTEKFPQKQLLVKVHPLTTKSHRFNLMRIKNVQVFSSPIPAELFISSLKNSIVISGWSTALLFENDSCSFYWLYQFFKNRNPEISYIQINNPTSHIKMIEELKDINPPQ